MYLENMNFSNKRILNILGRYSTKTAGNFHRLYFYVICWEGQIDGALNFWKFPDVLV